MTRRITNTELFFKVYIALSLPLFSFLYHVNLGNATFKGYWASIMLLVTLILWVGALISIVYFPVLLWRGSDA